MNNLLNRGIKAALILLMSIIIGPGQNIRILKSVITLKNDYEAAE